MYCTKADMVARYSEAELIGITDKEGLIGNINDAVLNQAIADSSAEIDSYLVNLYPLPLLFVNDALTRFACDITRFYLYDIGAIEPVVKRYDAAIAYLKQVSKGTIRLQVKPITNVSTTEVSDSIIDIQSTRKTNWGG